MFDNTDSKAFLENFAVAQLVKKYVAFIMFTETRHRIIS